MTGTRTPDMLVFNDVLDEPYMVGWNGSWPPPERMVVAVGHETGYVSIFDDDPDLIAIAVPISKVTRCLRETASLHDDLVIRGAVYRPIVKST